MCVILIYWTDSFIDALIDAGNNNEHIIDFSYSAAGMHLFTLRK